jgi:hypothetical protein
MDEIPWVDEILWMDEIKWMDEGGKGLEGILQ